MKRSTTFSSKVYKFVHYEDVWIKTNLTGREFDKDKNSWLTIENDGTITVKGSNPGGYAWDGCSPKWNCLHITWGTPDGKLDYNTEKPMTYYASMIHDAIYQYKNLATISRKEADILLKLILKKAKYMWWWKYALGVRVFGGFYGKWNRKGCQSRIKITEYSWLLDINNN